MKLTENKKKERLLFLIFGIFILCQFVFYTLLDIGKLVIKWEIHNILCQQKNSDHFAIRHDLSAPCSFVNLDAGAITLPVS